MAEPAEPVCIYIARVEIRAASTSANEMRYCFVPAPNPDTTGERLARALDDAGHALVRTDFLQSYWDYEWPQKSVQKRYDGYAEQAYRGREVVLSPPEDA